jgi:hypothetical protein
LTVSAYFSKCRGDSGGPLMFLDRKIGRYILIAIVEGAIRDCGDVDFPGIYVRMDHPSILDFIESNIKPKSKGNMKIINYNTKFIMMLKMNLKNLILFSIMI